ncbi:unnamed protein product [Heligmosomoides polygyrus]|uniref:AAA_11 domain-containing protein n=1 Tax=Heligmosomoides polygyrus TaxID=6339 RepID=A0A183FSE3_HELPZ|nr:unnamed protein product [Heligmosomoides polygyrus]
MSAAIRFSEPVVSKEARLQLYEYVQHFIPVYANEGIMPLKVLNLRAKDREWLQDRALDFTNYVKDPSTAKRKMGKLFNVCCSALAATSTLHDDKTVYWITATVPSRTACPLRLDVTLADMATDGGWTLERQANFWVSGAPHAVRLRAVEVLFITERKQLSVRLAASSWNHRRLCTLVDQHGREDDGQYVVDGYVVLAKATQSASQSSAAVSHMLRSLNSIAPDTTGSQILDIVYGHKPADPTPNEETDPQRPHPAYPTTSVYKGQTLSLTADQHAALALGLKGAPIAAIQAAFGTGKTVYEALVAGLLVARGKGPVIVTASTNHAVAHFANTLLALNDFSKLNLLRFISESAYLDEAPSTTVDINEILKDLGLKHAASLSLEERDACARYRNGRLLYEAHVRHFEHSMVMTDKERDEYLTEETDVSRTVKKVLRAMLRVRPPHILLITTASLINTTSANGIFKNKLQDRKTLIVDDASQVPEPVLATLASLFPQSCQLYLGDIHQMFPHVKCHREANTAVFGAQSTLKVLQESSIGSSSRAHYQLSRASGAE